MISPIPTSCSALCLIDQSAGTPGIAGRLVAGPGRLQQWLLGLCLAVGGVIAAGGGAPLMATEYSLYPIPLPAPVPSISNSSAISADGHSVAYMTNAGTLYRWSDAAPSSVSSVAPGIYNNSQSNNVRISNNGLVVGTYTSGSGGNAPNYPFYLPAGSSTPTIDIVDGGDANDSTGSGAAAVGYFGQNSEAPFIWLFNGGAPTVVTPTLTGAYAGLDSVFQCISPASGGGYWIGGGSIPTNTANPLLSFSLKTNAAGVVQSVVALPASSISYANGGGSLQEILPDGTGVVLQGQYQPTAANLAYIRTSSWWNGTTLTAIPLPTGYNTLSGYGCAQVGGTATVVGELAYWDGTTNDLFTTFVWSPGQSTVLDVNAGLVAGGAGFWNPAQIAGTGQIIGQTPIGAPAGWWYPAILTPLPQVSVSGQAEISKSQTLTLTVTRTASGSAPLVTSWPLTVPLIFSGTASQLGDYTPATTTAVIPVGQTSVTVTVTFIADGAYAAPKTVIATVAAPNPSDYLPTLTWLIPGDGSGVSTTTLISNIAAPAATPVISSTLSASAAAGVPFSYLILASDAPTSYNATGLPAGLFINAATGEIYGTPAVPGFSSVTISATNGSGTGTATLALTISPATVQYTLSVVPYPAGVTTFNVVSGAISPNGQWVEADNGDGTLTTTSTDTITGVQAGRWNVGSPTSTILTTPGGFGFAGGGGIMNDGTMVGGIYNQDSNDNTTLAYPAFVGPVATSWAQVGSTQVNVNAFDPVSGNSGGIYFPGTTGTTGVNWSTGANSAGGLFLGTLTAASAPINLRLNGVLTGSLVIPQALNGSKLLVKTYDTLGNTYLYIGTLTGTYPPAMTQLLPPAGYVYDGGNMYMDSQGHVALSLDQNSTGNQFVGYYNGNVSHTFAVVAPSSGSTTVDGWENGGTEGGIATVNGVSTIVGEVYTGSHPVFVWHDGDALVTQLSTVLPAAVTADLEYSSFINAQGQILAAGNISLPGTADSPILALMTPIATVSASLASGSSTIAATDSGAARSRTITVSRADVATLTVNHLNWALAVNLSLTAGSTAVLGTDYTLSGAGLVGSSPSDYVLTIPAGQASASITVTALPGTAPSDLTLAIGAAAALPTAYQPTDCYLQGAPTLLTIAADENLGAAITTPSGLPVTNHAITVTVTFTQPVTVGASPILTANAGSLSGLPAAGATGTIFTASWTPPAGFNLGTVLFNVPASVASAGALANTAAQQVSLTYDTQPPAAPVITAPANGATIGTGVTVSGTLLGTAEYPTAITVSVTAGSTTHAATVTGSSWSATFSGLAAGPLAISAIAADPIGNTSPASTIVSVTVDTTPPTLVATLPATPTNSNRPTFSGTVQDVLIVTLTCALDGSPSTLAGSFNAFTNPPTSAAPWSFVPTAAIPDGPHTLVVTATDALGNTAVSQSLPITTDTTAPSTTLGMPSLTLVKANSTVTIAVTYADAGTGVTHDTLAAANISFAASGASAGSVTVAPSSASFPAGSTGSIVTLSNFSGNGVLSMIIAPGTAVDGAGNLAPGAQSAANQVITVDTTPPVAPVILVPANLAVIGSSTTVSGTVAETGLTVSVLGGPAPVAATVLGTSWSATLTGLIPGAALAAVATDAAGNVSLMGQVTVTVDVTAPLISITSAAVTNRVSPTISGSVGDTAYGTLTGATVTVKNNGTAIGTAVIATSAAANSSWSFTPAAPLAAGSYSLSAQITDAIGNTGLSPTQSLLIDITPPTISLGSPSASLVRANSTAIITVTYGDEIGGSGLGAITLASPNVSVITLTGTASATATVSAVDSSTATITLSGFTGNGTLGVAIAGGTAADNAGNLATAVSSSAAQRITVDTTIPVATLATTTPVAPASTAAATIPITLTFNEGMQAGTVAVGDLLATNCQLSAFAASGGAATSWTAILTPNLGATAFSVQYASSTAADPAGNLIQASSNTLSFNVAANPVAVTVNQAAGQADPTSGSSIAFTALFSQAVSGFTAAQVTLGGTVGGTPVAVVSNPSSDGKTFTITVTGMAATSGTVTAAVGADAVVATLGGQPNAASTSTDNAVTWNVPLSGGGGGGSQPQGTSGSGCGLGSGTAAVLLGALLSLMFLRRRDAGASALPSRGDRRDR